MLRFSVLCLFLSISASPLFAGEPARVDKGSDPLPEHALARLGTVHFRQGTAISRVVYSPDGKILASTSYFDGKIILWDSQTGLKMRELEGYPSPVTSLAFSPDSKRLVSGCQQLAYYKSIRWSEDLRVWDVAKGTLIFQLLDNKETTQAVAFSPDGKTFASGHYSVGVRLWDAQTGKIIRVLPPANADMSVQKIVFTPDGQRLAVIETKDTTIRFWEVQTGKSIQRELKPTGVIYDLAFSPDGKTLAVALGEGVCLYDTSSLEELHRLKGHQGSVFSQAFFPNSKSLVTCGEDYTFRVWDVTSGKQRYQFSKPDINRGNFALSPDGKTIATIDYGWSGVIRFWDAKTGEPQHLRRGPHGAVFQVAFQSDEKTVVSTGNEVFVWPSGRNKEANLVELPKDFKTCRLCAGGTTLAVATTTGSVSLLDIASHKELVSCPIGNPKIEAIDISAENKRMAVQVEGNLQVWDLVAKKQIHRFESAASCVEFSPDGRMVSLLFQDPHENPLEKHLVIWDLDRNQEVYRGEKGWDGCRGVAFSPDGRTIAMAVRVYDPFTPGPIIRYVRLVELATGKERLVLQRDSNAIYTIAFSHDGKTLATGGKDQKVRLWDVRDGKELNVFPGHSDSVYAIAFSHDDRKLLSGSHDTTALLWEIPAGSRGPKTKVKLDRGEQNKLWRNLANEDATAAYAAMQRLGLGSADAIALCRNSLLEASPTPPGHIQQWIGQLDAEEYAVREQASANLERVEAEAKNDLEKALTADCSPEVRRRIEALLQLLKEKQLGLRVKRAVELLEQIGTTEAVDVLRHLEKKTGDAAVRDDVRRSLDRLQAKQKAR